MSDKKDKNLPTKLYTSAGSRELDRIAITDFKQNDLMARAGSCVFKYIKKNYKAKKYNVLIVCGKGNNAGDGLITAKLLKQANYGVAIYYLESPKDYKNAARAAYLSLKDEDITVLDNLPDKHKFNLIVDGLLGTGLKGSLKKAFIETISWINAQKASVLAIDIPSGLNADTGLVEDICVYANVTITFIALKQGMFLGNAKQYTGKIIYESLGLPPEVYAGVPASVELITKYSIKDTLAKRNQAAHKGDFGHVVIIGSGEGSLGAAKLAALGAFRVGAGLVTIGTTVEHAKVINIDTPEIMTKGISSSEDIKQLISKADVIAIGPGLSLSDWGKMCFETLLLTKANQTIVMDADALNHLASSQAKNDNWILTPHPKEAARLLQLSCEEVQADRKQVVLNLQAKFAGVAVLKGANTLIAGENSTPKLSINGTPAMATAGMGDLLTGIIAGLCAQGANKQAAAQAGVYIHARAGELAAKSGARGLMTTDLLPFIRYLADQL